ncbi:hypothetical protein [Paraburkholderia humisilvae]|uniref:Uncharacterized protein n=1 Tax=Paraburkholderia humisilvae TaxID=627669 RepID=A0A6J5DLI0_9BURK|nr:hypothetical protein [Paraburkholderia humisilvae]CAB3754833.1 hypothetical protein LMG29542_02465 [Paraburkholderia humisilvae]
MTDLHSVTPLLLANLGASVQKVEAHEPNDPESSDLLWLSMVDEDLTEGDVLCVSALSGGRWMVHHDLAHKYGGWPTVWDVAGSETDVVGAVSTYINNRR